jgi:hypothetical protein
MMITVTVPAGYRMRFVVQQDGTIVVILEPVGFLGWRFQPGSFTELSV